MGRNGAMCFHPLATNWSCETLGSQTPFLFELCHIVDLSFSSNSIQKTRLLFTMWWQVADTQIKKSYK